MKRIKLSPQEVEERYNIDAGTLANWRSQKKGPCYSKVGKVVRYDVDALEEFFKQHEVKTSN